MSKGQGEIVVDEAVEGARRFLLANPGVAVAGAALVAQLFSALPASSPIRKGSSRAAVRDWLTNACETLPNKKQFESAAKSAGIPTSYMQLKGALLSQVERLMSDH